MTNKIEGVTLGSTYAKQGAELGIKVNKTFLVPMEHIYIEPGFNVRNLDPEHVESIRQGYDAGQPIPPITVKTTPYMLLEMQNKQMASVLVEINEYCQLNKIGTIGDSAGMALIANHKALAAQVEALRNLLDNVRRSEEFIVDHAIMLGVDCDLADEIDATLEATKQQHLREIRAEAIEEALDYMYSNTSSGNSAGDDFDLIREYAESIRNAKDGEA